jgi:hypothetical protein
VPRRRARRSETSDQDRSTARNAKQKSESSGVRRGRSSRHALCFGESERFRSRGAQREERPCELGATDVRCCSANFLRRFPPSGSVRETKRQRSRSGRGGAGLCERLCSRVGSSRKNLGSLLHPCQRSMLTESVLARVCQAETLFTARRGRDGTACSCRSGH